MKYKIKIVGTKMKHLILNSTFYVVKNSKDVKINLKSVEKFVEENKEIKPPDWDKEIHFCSEDREKVLNYLLLIDCNNFCFWGSKKEGYFDLALSLKNIFENYPQKANLYYFSKISLEEFIKFLPFIKNIHLTKERWLIAKKVASYIVKNYKGEFYNFVKKAKNSAKKLIEKIFKELYSFNDFRIFNNKRIYFLKRAQHLTSNIWGALDGKEIADFYDLDYLTAFADYRLPQILNYYEILEYSEKLRAILKNEKIIKQNSRLETEIRANTVWAVEYLKQKFKERGINIYSFQVDWYLWNLSNKIKFKLPFHRTITYFY
jgi:hypothetical protein